MSSLGCKCNCADIFIAKLNILPTPPPPNLINGLVMREDERLNFRDNVINDLSGG